MKRFLMISYPFPPNASAGAVRSERFARYLSELGWAIDVITIKPRSDLFEDKDRLIDLGADITVQMTNTFDPWLWLRDKKPVNIIGKAFRSAIMKIFSYPDHMLFWVPFAVWKGIKINKKTPVDIIYTTSPPHTAHLAGKILACFLKKPWVVDFRDPWTLNAYKEYKNIEKTFLFIEKRMEKAVLKKASKILANTEANRQNMLNAFSYLNPDKVIKLSNGWEDFSVLITKYNENDRFTIVHSGNFYPDFKPYGLFYALAQWQDGNQPKGIPPLNDIKVILLGARDSETKKIVDELNLDHIVKIEPWVPLDKAREIMSNADLLWASLGTDKKASTYIPSKLFEYIVVGKPIIGFFPEGEAADFIRKTGTGIVFTSDEIEPIIKVLYNAMSVDNPKSLNWFNPNTNVINSYHIKNIVEKLNDILSMEIK